MDVKSASRRVLQLGKIQRRPELDALRGLFLVWMTLTHLPTRLSELVNQPFGFVSSAEGFVFLSAMLVATLYIHRAAGRQRRRAQQTVDAGTQDLWLPPDHVGHGVHRGGGVRRPYASCGHL